MGFPCNPHCPQNRQHPVTQRSPRVVVVGTSAPLASLCRPQPPPLRRAALGLASSHPDSCLTSHPGPSLQSLKQARGGHQVGAGRQQLHTEQGSGCLLTSEEGSPCPPGQDGTSCPARLSTSRLSCVSGSPGSPSPPSPPPPASSDGARRFFREHLPLMCLWGHLLSQRKEDGWESV